MKAWLPSWPRQIRELYCRNRERLRHVPGSTERAVVEFALRDHVANMVVQRDIELADKKLRAPCHTALASLPDHWDGMTRFVNDARNLMDNNYGERLIRDPAVGRRNYYGSGSEWSGRLAMHLFSIIATLKLWHINPRRGLMQYLEARANSGSKAPANVSKFSP